jgi:hypothetical protein
MSRRPEIRIRTDQLDKFRALTKCATTTALAGRMGVSVDTVRRTLGGETALTVNFIEALLGAFPELTIGDLFTVDTPAPVGAGLAS